MSSQNGTAPTGAQAPPYPWYDDRVETVRSGYVNPWDDVEELRPHDTPRQIYDYLDKRVWKQTEAKKAAPIIAYNCLQGIKSNAIFIGPTSCGKTHVGRSLKQLFPDRIEIANSSSLSLDGWKRALKWRDLLRPPIFRSGNHCILVMDEADKMLTPKYSKNENVSQSVQAEGLTLMEGTCVDGNALFVGSFVNVPPLTGSMTVMVFLCLTATS